jgi:hypothetical protein
LPNEYNVDDAVRDAQVYHAKCSFYVGLVALSEAVEEKASCEESRVRREALLVELSKADISAVRRSEFEAELASLRTRVSACQ